jgi:4-hydroxybenzoate polyprenyltransferase
MTTARAIFAQLRVHQWVKNLLVFGALLLSHNWSDRAKAVACVQAFIAFSLAASSAYTLNDLLDRNADRLHPSKRLRPIACGTLHAPTAIVLAILLAAGGLAIAATISQPFLVTLAIYLAVTVFYSVHGKRQVMLDVLILSGLYSIRLYAGGIAAHIVISTWTIAYTSFVFLSLALLKRYAELTAEPSIPERRGYQRQDAPIVATLGCASGLIAALPLALYAGSPEVLLLYRLPRLLWLLCGVHVYWVSRIWIFAHRGQVRDDPVVFTLRDGASWYLAAVAVGILWLASASSG